MNPLLRPWRHLFDFSGRATRTEFFLFHLTGLVALAVAGVVIGMIAALVSPGRSPDGHAPGWMIAVLLLSYVLFFVTHVAIYVRRLHDHNEPGAKYLLSFIPIVGIFFYLMGMFKAGDEFENDYGPDPRRSEQLSPDSLGGVFS